MGPDDSLLANMLTKRDSRCAYWPNRNTHHTSNLRTHPDRNPDIYEPRGIFSSRLLGYPEQCLGRCWELLYKRLHNVKGGLRGPAGYGDGRRIVGMQMWTNGTRGARVIGESLKSNDGEDVKAPRRARV